MYMDGFAEGWSRLLWRAGLLALGYLAGAEIGHGLSVKSLEQAFAGFWPPAGILLAALVLSPVRTWPWMMAAACGANLISDVLLHGQTVATSLGFCTANCVEAGIGAGLLRRFVGRPITLRRVEEVLGLAFWSALLGPLVGATLGAWVVHLAFGTPYWSAWAVWSIADGVGVLVLAPLVLTWAGMRWAAGKCDGWRLLEAVGGFAGLLVVTEGVYGNWLPQPFTVPIFILPFLLWAGLRLGPRGAATALAVVAVIGLWNTGLGRGPYAGLTSDPAARVLRAQATMFVVSLTVLVLAAIVAERRQAERQRTRLIAELEQALAEIRTLRGLIPVCAWCKKMRNDEGLWQSIEEYLQAHTDARVSHGICADCMERQLATLGTTVSAEE